MPTPSRALGPGERWLPIADMGRDIWGHESLCGGVGYLGTSLHGSPDDPRLTWMVTMDGTRAELAWPVGFSARFAPELELLDAQGRVVAKEGSSVAGGCLVSHDPDVYLVDF